jgi:hypothetical protein
MAFGYRRQWRPRRSATLMRRPVIFLPRPRKLTPSPLANSSLLSSSNQSGPSLVTVPLASPAKPGASKAPMSAWRPFTK